MQSNFFIEVALFCLSEGVDFVPNSWYNVICGLAMAVKYLAH